MSDPRCERCHHKLLANESGSGVVVVKCDRCKALNRVTLDRYGVMVAK